MIKKTIARRADGEATRERILAAALKLFRKRGFERTTMRLIATDASVSLGATYHYFASKDAIVFDYYVRRERDLSAKIAGPLAEAKDLRARLGVIMHGKFDLFQGDRALLAGLFRAATDPESKVSVFAEETSTIRDASIASFQGALRDEPLSDELRIVAASALWVVHLGLMLFYLHDRSPNQSRARALATHALDLSVDLVRIVGLPGADALRERITRILFDVMAPSEEELRSSPAKRAKAKSSGRDKVKRSAIRAPRAPRKARK